MKRCELRNLIILLAFSAAIFAQKPQAARVDATQANVRATIEYLASDKLEGRRTGEPGATAAADYIRKQFTAIGLRPEVLSRNGTSNYKTSYLQPFPYVTGVEMAKTGNAFSLDITIDGNRMT